MEVFGNEAAFPDEILGSLELLNLAVARVARIGCVAVSNAEGVMRFDLVVFLPNDEDNFDHYVIGHITPQPPQTPDELIAALSTSTAIN